MNNSDAVDLWLIISAVLFAIALLVAVVEPTKWRFNAFVAGGLLAFIVAQLTARH